MNPSPETRTTKEASTFDVQARLRYLCETVARNRLPNLTTEALKAVESLQPYNRWDLSPEYLPHPLRTLHTLSRIDKHRQHIVVATTASGSAYAIPDGYDWWVLPSNDPLELNAYIGFLKSEKPVDPSMNMEPIFTLRVTFEDVWIPPPGARSRSCARSCTLSARRSPRQSFRGSCPTTSRRDTYTTPEERK